MGLTREAAVVVWTPMVLRRARPSIWRAQCRGVGAVKLSVNGCEALVAWKPVLALRRRLEGTAVEWASRQRACMEGAVRSFVLDRTLEGRGCE